ncbi:hypothetical protein EV183_003121 [Coemansia sp. RSA 2336]|nr:hypothetical protein EV183_003121 [Coemansia sp. RSA 2336]
MDLPANKLEPVRAGVGDVFTLILGAVLMFVNTLLFVYVLWNRDYPPLRAKNIKLIAILYLSMLIWYLGTIGTNFNLYNYFNFKSTCILFGLWFRILLGVFMFIHVHVFRLYVYIRIFIRLRRVDYRQYAIALFSYIVIICSVGIPLSILRNKLTVQYITQLETCIYGDVFIEVSFVIVWVGWATTLVFTFLARKINSSFKEYREMLLIVFLASIAITYMTVVHHIWRAYTLHQWSRVTTTYAEYIASQSSLFILLSVPAYNCMFHREEYRRKFFDKMRSDGMASRYSMTLPSAGTNTQPQTA